MTFEESDDVSEATDIEIKALQWFVEQRIEKGAAPWIVSAALYFVHLDFDVETVQPAPEWAEYLRRMADYLEQNGQVLPFPPPPLTAAWKARMGMEP